VSENLLQNMDHQFQVFQCTANVNPKQTGHIHQGKPHVKKWHCIFLDINPLLVDSKPNSKALMWRLLSNIHPISQHTSLICHLNPRTFHLKTANKANGMNPF